jgi:hypothetical protein
MLPSVSASLASSLRMPSPRSAPPAEDRQVVVTLIDSKLAEPPFSI